MTINKKGKRRLIHQNTEYFWSTERSHDSDLWGDCVVTVLTENKEFIVKYNMDQISDHFVVVMGSKFYGRGNIGSGIRRFASPKFGDIGFFTPANTIQLLDWCLDKDKVLQLVNYLGKPTDCR